MPLPLGYCPVNLIWVVRLELTTNLVPKTSRLPIAAHPYKEYCFVFRVLYQTELHPGNIPKIAPEWAGFHLVARLNEPPAFSLLEH